MQHSQLLRLFYERFAVLLRELSPSLTEMFGDSGVVEIWAVRDQFLSLDLTPHHEGVEGSFDVVRLRRSPFLNVYIKI